MLSESLNAPMRAGRLDDHGDEKAAFAGARLCGNGRPRTGCWPCWVATLPGEAVEFVDGPVAGDRPLDQSAAVFSGVFVDDGHDLWLGGRRWWRRTGTSDQLTPTRL